MGLSRQFLNLIVWDETFTARSLRCIDFRRLQLFHPDLTVLTAATEASAATVDSTMRRTVIPSPTFSFKATQSEGFGEPGNKDIYDCSASCVPVAGRKVFCTDACGRSLLFDADTRQVVTMPTLPKFKWRPVSVFVPSADGYGDPDPDGTLFILPRKPKQERRDLGPQSPQFDALLYRRSSMTAPTKSWHHQLLPPLPYLREPKYWRVSTLITSYAVLGGGSHICVSAYGAGTYCLDTVSHTWSKVGDWMLPFSGKAEYVPELNLWFGIGIYKSEYGGSPRDTDQLVAADLSTLDSKPEPEVVGTWQELDHHIPIDNNSKPDYSCSRSKVVYLGSRRFCIARFFSGSYLLEPSKRLSFVVFTGVEVTPQVLGGICGGGGEGKFRMFRHKSRVAPTARGYVDHMF